MEDAIQLDTVGRRETLGVLGIVFRFFGIVGKVREALSRSSIALSRSSIAQLYRTPVAGRSPARTL